MQLRFTTFTFRLTFRPEFREPRLIFLCRGSSTSSWGEKMHHTTQSTQVKENFNKTPELRESSAGGDEDRPAGTNHRLQDHVQQRVCSFPANVVEDWSLLPSFHQLTFIFTPWPSKVTSLVMQLFRMKVTFSW